MVATYHSWQPCSSAAGATDPHRIPGEGAERAQDPAGTPPGVSVGGENALVWDSTSVGPRFGTFPWLADSRFVHVLTIGRALVESCYA